MTDKELSELREQAELGRKNKIAKEVINDFLLYERAYGVNDLETGNKFMYEDLMFSKIYLMVLRKLENRITAFIDSGEIAEKELNENVS